MPKKPLEAIPDIQVTGACDESDPHCDVHYETFGRLARVFGRDTPAHRHSRFFQIHLLCSGSIHLELDDAFHSGKAPLVFLTPPAVPHAFCSDEESDGHVITIRQEVVRMWSASMPGLWTESQLRHPAFMQLGDAAARARSVFSRLLQLASMMRDESAGREKGCLAAMHALGQYFFIELSRLFNEESQVVAGKCERSEDQRVFLGFCDLVEAHFREHLTLSDYASRLAVTEARLNDVSRRVAGLPSKALVNERLLQEARRLLQFSATPVGELSYQLGFKDPAYFSRFFNRGTGLSPSQFRARHQDQHH